MYELVILGELLEGDKSGYKLGQILNNILGPGRKISNGTLHPILVKLSQAGKIVWQADPSDPRGKKLARITDAGSAHFQQLMSQPVKQNARLDETYRFKISQLQKVPLEVKLQILQDYKVTTQAEYDEYQEHWQHVSQLENKDMAEIEWTLTTIELYLHLAQTRLQWIDTQIVKLKEGRQ